MNLNRIWRILRKDLAVGPRKPFFIFAIIMPFAFTLIFQVAFGSLFEPKPRLGIIDEGASAITAAVREMDGIELTMLEDIEELKNRVKNNDLDAGLVLSIGFDQAVQAGEKPKLEFFIGGESLASNRLIITVTALDLIRGIEERDAPVDIKTVYFGEAGLPISIRLVPLIVFYALVLAGLWVPASSLVEEKEKGTLAALLVTSVRTSEVLVAKWLLGFVFASFIAALTLLLNNAFGPRPFEVLVVIFVAAALTAVLGLLFGLYSKNSTMMFTLIKGTGIFLFAPVIFYIFPDWPQWIAKLFPLYWIIEPIWSVSIMGKSLQGVWLELAVALAITAALIPAVKLMSGRMQT